MSGLKPIGSNILFEWFEQELTEGGILMPTGTSAEAKSTSITALVKGVGSQVKHVKVGDRIVLPKLMKTSVIPEKGLYITSEAQVYAVL